MLEITDSTQTEAGQPSVSRFNIISGQVKAPCQNVRLVMSVHTHSSSVLYVVGG